MKFSTYTLWGVLIALLWTSCSDKEYSEDYDINFPRPQIDSISPSTQFVGQDITIYGKDFYRISSVLIEGTYACSIVSVDTTVENKHKMIVTIPRTVDRGAIYMKNHYKIETHSTVIFTPQFLDVTITNWATTVELGRTFKVEGSNMDMIKKATINGKEAQILSADPKTAIISIASIPGLSVGDIITVQIETRTGNSVNPSPGITVLEPTDYFAPAWGHLLFDFETDVNVTAGDASIAYTTGYNLKGIKGIGRVFSVTSATSNKWDGVYCSISADNGGKGYDLSSFHDPCLTFLVNTNNKDGYFSFDVVQEGKSNGDKHFDEKLGKIYGYSDNYKFNTKGWEWRSYRLSDFGFSANFSGKIDMFKLLFRGGNCDGEFEIHVDQVMITDGLINAVKAMDFEAGEPLFPNPQGLGGGGSPTAKLNAGTGSNINSGFEGGKYFTVKAADSHNGEYGSIISPLVTLANFNQNYNALYLNFLLNTGNAGYGYFQLVIRQGSKWTLKHFYGHSLYTDSYSMNTGSKWQWRSYSLDPRNQKWDWTSENGTHIDIDFSQAFQIEFSFKNNDGVNPYETNVDYIYMSNVPMSPTSYK